MYLPGKDTLLLSSEQCTSLRSRLRSRRFADLQSTGRATLARKCLVRETWKAQATLRVPIYDGGRRDARRAEAASALRSEQIRSRDLRQQVELELRTALKELQSAEAQMKAAQEGLDLSNNELAQARRRYEAGITTSVEVTDAQTRLARARDNYTIALYGHNVARLDLQAAMGAIGQLVQ